MVTRSLQLAYSHRSIRAISTVRAIHRDAIEITPVLVFKATFPLVYEDNKEPLPADVGHFSPEYLKTV